MKAIITNNNDNTLLNDVRVIQPNEIIKGLWFLAMTGEIKHLITDLGDGLAILRTYQAPLPYAVKKQIHSMTIGGDATVILGDVGRREPDEGEM